MVVCLNCGAGIPDGSDRCRMCGTPVNAGALEQQVPGPAAPAPGSHAHGKKNDVFLLVMFILFGVMVLGMSAGLAVLYILRTG